MIPPRDRPAERALAALGYGAPRAHRGPGWAAAAVSVARPTPRALARLLRHVAALAAAPDADLQRPLVVPVETVVLAVPAPGAHVCAWATVADAGTQVGPQVRAALAFGLPSGGAVAATLRARLPRVSDVPFSVEPPPVAPSAARAAPLHPN